MKYVLGFFGVGLFASPWIAQAYVTLVQVQQQLAAIKLPLPQ